jgi:hypothetical protein
MTARRPAPIRRDEISRDIEEQKQGAGTEPVMIAAIAEPPAAQPSAKPSGFGDAIKRLFGEVKKTLTGKAVALKPKRRRKRGEDTRGLFKKLAMKILAPVARSIFHADFAWFMPPDELDETQRLMMRQTHTQNDGWMPHANAAFPPDHQNHLSPRP